MSDATRDVAALKVEDVTKTYGEGDAVVTAVAGASFSVVRGEIVLVQGPSGSGKTTLLAMCGALLRPDAGRIWVDGVEVTAQPERRLPEVRLRRVGFVFQAANLLANLSALENVQVVIEAAGAKRQDASRRARDLLSQLRLADRLDSLPRQLSGGEAQRVAIARALANDAPVLLADEPTANLDSRAGYQLMHTLELLAKEEGRAVLAVTHDHRVEDVADRVLWLEDGHLADRPPSVTETARDPVCGMTISVERAAASRVVRDRSYMFCSEICVDRFDADPARFIDQEADSE